MATTIVTKSGSGAPTTDDLIAGELAVDLTNGRLYTEDSGGTVLELGLNPSGNVNVTGTVTADKLTTNGAAEGDTYFTGGTASSRLLNVFTSTYDGAANAGHNFKIASGQGAFIFGNNTTANLLTVESGGIDVTGSVTADGLSANGDITLDRSGVQKRGIKWNRSGTIDAAINLDSDEIVKFDNFYNGRYQFRSGASGSEVLRLDIATGGDISFYEDTGTTPKLFWDASAESLGIGTSSPSNKLHVNADAGGSALAYLNNTNSQGYGLLINTPDINNARYALRVNTGAGTPFFVGNGGNVGIGTGSPTSYASNCLHLNAASTSISLRLTNSTTGSTVSDGSDIEVDGSNLNIVNRESGNIALYTSATERMRITNIGYTKMSPTGTYISAAGTYHEMYQNNAGITGYIYNGSATGDGLLINTNNENTSNYFLAGYSDSALRYNVYIYSNGNLLNRFNSYGGFSDQKLKQDIEDASSQWDDVKAMQFRKYRWKQDVAVDANAPYQLGVIAQELEAAGMSGLVEETADKEFYDEVCLDEEGNPVVDEDGNNVTEQKERLTGESTKSVKYSILTMKALVALQEAMTRIESLEARIAALES